jgi:hypothetical protein
MKEETNYCWIVYGHKLTCTGYTEDWFLPGPACMLETIQSYQLIVITLEAPMSRKLPVQQYHYN